MPTVILPAKDVAAAAERLLEQIQNRAVNPTFPRVVLYEMRAADPHPEKLTAIIDAAKWLANMHVPNPQIGLTMEEASLLEPMLPKYA